MSCHSVLDMCNECFDTDLFEYPFSGFLKGNFKPINKNALAFTEKHNKQVDAVVEEIQKLLEEDS